MDEKLKKLTAKREKAEAELRELKRKEQMRAASISEAARKADNKRKILKGSWLDNLIAQGGELKATTAEELGALMMRDLNRNWLIRDDERRLFGFEVLTDKQKAAHPKADAIRRGGRKRAASSANPPAAGGASASPSDSSAPAPAAEPAETKQA